MQKEVMAAAMASTTLAATTAERAVEGLAELATVETMAAGMIQKRKPQMKTTTERQRQTQMVRVRNKTGKP